jgi:hypothetical protein
MTAWARALIQPAFLAVFLPFEYRFLKLVSSSRFLKPFSSAVFNQVVFQLP